MNEDSLSVTTDVFPNEGKMVLEVRSQRILLGFYNFLEDVKI